jgi:hypothetical protein
MKNRILLSLTALAVFGLLFYLWDDFREKGILSTVDITQNKSTIKNIVEKIKAPFKPKVKQQSKNQDMER